MNTASLLISHTYQYMYILTVMIRFCLLERIYTLSVLYVYINMASANDFIHSVYNVIFFIIVIY